MRGKNGRAGVDCTAGFFHASIDYPVGRTELSSMDAKRISNELSKVQLQLEKIKMDLQK